MTKLTLKITRREKASGWMSFLVMLGSLLGGLLLASLLFWFKGVPPLFFLQKILLGSFGSLYGFQETVTKAIPLMLISAGLCVAFKSKFWNIGAEGQLLMGAVGVTFIALRWHVTSPWLMIPFMMIAGFLMGGVYGLIPAWLKAKYQINETIVTLMLNYIAYEFVQYLVVGPWKGKTRYGFPYTDTFPDSATLSLIPGSRIHWLTLLFAVFFCILMYLFIEKSIVGYRVRVIGNNQDAAKYSGISFMKTSLWAMMISGGLAGLAGMGEVAGIHHHLANPISISSNYGFTAIIVTWLANLNPLVVIITSVLFGGILVGGDIIQTSMQLPFATIQVFNGFLLFCIMIGQYILKNRIRITKTLPMADKP